METKFPPSTPLYFLVTDLFLSLPGSSSGLEWNQMVDTLELVFREVKTPKRIGTDMLSSKVTLVETLRKCTALG